MEDLKNRIKGCLVGVAAGDAMGMPSSMMSPETIREKFGYIRFFLPAPGDHIIHENMSAAEVTDDTQQTLLIADSIIEKGFVDSRDIAIRLIEWGESVNAFDSMVLGPSSLRALYAIRSGKSIQESGSVGDTNGAVMRIAAVGIFGFGDLEKTIDAVENACLPTHNTNIAIAGASAIAHVIGLGVSGEKDIDKMIEDALKAAEMGMRRGNIWYGASIIERTKLAMEIVERPVDKTRKMQLLYEIIGAGVQTTETVPTCLALLKLAQGDPVEGILLAANLGGDCDTIGAITGSMCGAISGVDAFPEEWIEKLESVNAIDFSGYAEKLTMIIQNS